MVAAITGTLLGPGPMIVAGFSLLITAVAHDTGWSRATFSMIMPVISWTAAPTAPLYGRLMDRFGVRRVMIPAIAALGLFIMGLGLLTHTTWQFFLAYFLLGTVASASSPVGFNRFLMQWFIKNRGLTISLCAAVGSGVGYALAPQIVNKIINTYGWRGAYVGLSLLILCISVPVTLIFMRDRGQPDPETVLSARDHAAQLSAREGLTFREGVKTRTLWLLVAIMFLQGNAYYGVLVHFVPIVTDCGLSRGIAATAISFVALGAIGGQLTASLVLDRVSSARVALPFVVCGVIGLLLIQSAHTPFAFDVAAILIGVGQGSENSVIGYMTSRLLGLKSFGVFFGLMFGAITFATGTGPLLMGYIFDRTGSYRPVMLAFDVMLLIAIAAVLCLPPYAYGHKITPGLSYDKPTRDPETV